jgi:hypothetical protein
MDIIKKKGQGKIWPGKYMKADNSDNRGPDTVEAYLKRTKRPVAFRGWDVPASQLVR